MLERARTLDYSHPAPGPTGKVVLSLTMSVLLGLIGVGFAVLGIVLTVVWATPQRDAHRDLSALVGICLITLGGGALAYFAYASVRDARSRVRADREP